MFIHNGILKISFSLLLQVSWISILPRPLPAIFPTSSINQLKIDRWGLAEGLPQNSVNNLIQTHDGYIWLATGNGIARFDGLRFRVFNDLGNGRLLGDVRFLHEDRLNRIWSHTQLFQPGAGDENIRLLCSLDFFCTVFHEDRQNRIWLGSNDGAFLYQDNQLLKLSGPEWVIACIEDSDGRIWVLDKFKGVWRYEENRFRLIRTWAELNFCELYAADYRAGMWTVLGDQGIRRFLGSDSLVEIPIAMLPQKNPLPQMHLFVDHRNRIWVSGIHGLICLPEANNSWKQVTAEPCLETPIIEDRQGTIWFAYQFGMARVKYNGHMQVEKLPVINETVFSILEDHQGNIWAGTRRGLFRIRESRIKAYMAENAGKSCSTVRLISQDRKGTIFFVLEDCFFTQLFHLDQDRMRPGFSNEKTESHFSCTHLFQDHQGRYWTWSARFGLATFLDSPRKLSPIPEFPPSMGMWAIHEDKHGVIWAGTNKGLFAIEAGKIRKESRIQGRIFRSMLTAADGRLWCAIEQGVWIRDAGKVYPAFPDSTLPKAAVMDIFQDRQHNIWLASNQGLFLCRKNKIRLFSPSQGLPNRYLLAIKEDRFGFLWISTMNGIIRLKKEELIALESGKPGKIHPQVYGQNEGMANSEGNSSHQSSLTDQAGRIWFCTMGGAVMIDPARFTIHSDPLLVYIENVTADGRSFYGGTLEIPGGTRRIGIQFTAIDFSNPRNVRFQYRLEGFDPHWQEISWPAPRLAVYTNLGPGRYRFRVQACNNDGVWNLAGASQPFVIRPLYWQTIWFKTLLAGSAFSLLYLLTRFIRRFLFLISFWRRKRIIGHYVLEEIIGYGSMATVFRAHHLLSKKNQVAVKILKQEHLQERINLQRFKREGALIDLLDHPHIASVISRGQYENTFFIVMEYLSGTTLAQRLRSEPQLPVDAIVSILLQLTQVLREIHRRGIIHRDLKPANIMLQQGEDGSDFVKLLDFGIASAPYHSCESEHGFFAGTLAYVAPEQIKKLETSNSDIYSLGMIGFEMASGHRPFSDRAPHELLEAILGHPPPRIADYRPDFPKNLAKIIERMLDKDPLNRPDLERIENELLRWS